MANGNYYGSKKRGTTYLDLYEQIEGEERRLLHKRVTDQDAYDTWHLCFYLREVIKHRRQLDQNKIAFEDLFRKEKNLLMYLALLASPNSTKIMEMGSTLFELIDGLEVVSKFCAQSNSKLNKLNIKDYSFIGVEISDEFSYVSRMLHPGYKIKLYDNYTKVNDTFDLIYDRVVTSYAFNNVDDLANYINKSKLAILNLYVSKEGTFISAILGKSLTYFSLKELLGKLNKPLYHLFGDRAPQLLSGEDRAQGRDVVEGFFLYGDKKTADNFIALAEKDSMVKAYFNEKNIRLTEAKHLLQHKK